jgi:putative spermidine/putrescine transport system ATP-binding protein
MRDGVIQQIGTPTDIYNEPKNAFVADFIGEMNFIAQPDGTTTAVRPENVTVSHGDGGDLRGVVRNIMMLGHYCEMTLDTEGGIVKAFMDAEQTKGFRRGEDVALSFNIAHRYDEKT